MKLPVHATREKKLRLEIMDILQGSSSQHPVQHRKLFCRLDYYPLGEVQAALDDLYHEHKIQRCLIVKYPKKSEPVETVVYWSVGTVQIPKCYIKQSGEHVNSKVSAA